jgi:hypothetical protein
MFTRARAKQNLFSREILVDNHALRDFCFQIQSWTGGGIYLR